MKRRWLRLVLWLTLGLAQPAPLAAVELNLLITSDQHGWLSSSHLFPQRKRHGLLHLEPHIRAIRAQDREALLLDGGDAVQGSPLVTWAHEQSPQHNPFTRKLHDLGYVALAVGNHDLETNPVFEAHDQGLPWLAANVRRQGKLVFAPYKLVQVKGLKIALLGLTTPGVHQWLSPRRLQGLEVEDMIAAAQAWVPRIRQQEQPDLLIALLHAGLDPRRDDAVSKLNNQPPSNASYDLLQQVPGIDLAVTGHDHRRIPYQDGRLPKVGTTYVVGGDSYGESLIQVTLQVERVAAAHQIRQATARIHFPVADPALDQAYRASLPPGYFAWLQRPTGWFYLGGGLQKLGDCLREVQAQAVAQPPAQGSALPSLRPSGIRAKEQITWRHLLAWVTYDNDLQLVRLNLRQIRLLEQSREVRLQLREPLPPPEPGWVLPRGDFVATRTLVLSSYHAQGGAGLAGSLLLQKEAVGEELNESLRSRIYSGMQQLRHPPPLCQGVMARALPPAKTKTAKRKTKAAKQG